MSKAKLLALNYAVNESKLKRKSSASVVAVVMVIFFILSPREESSWKNIITRYFVGAREHGRWKSELTFRIIEELYKADYKEKIVPVYPRL